MLTWMSTLLWFICMVIIKHINIKHINHINVLIQVSMLMLISYIYRKHVPVAAVLVLNTPDDGRLRPNHVQ